jgi:prepilin-type N-terminal cleavage/methylation domain-containing protein
MSSKGFTLIELIVVVSLLVIIGGVGASIFASVFRSYNKANIINRVEQNGNYALSVMESQIRNAQGVTLVDAKTLRVAAQDGSSTIEYRFKDSGGVGIVERAITTATGTVVTTLTDSDPNTGVSVVVANSSFAVSGTTPPVVTIVLKLKQASGMTRVDYQAETTLRTTVVVRGGYK